MLIQPTSLNPSLPAPDPAALAKPDQVAQAVSQAWQTLQSLPWAAHAAAAAGLVLGIALCLKGKDILKPCFALLGMLKGAAIGFFGAPMLGFDAPFGIPSPYLGAGIGALIGLGSGIALYRFAMAITGSLVGGLAAFLFAGAMMGLQPPAAPAPTPSTPLVTPTALHLQPTTPEPKEAEGRDSPASTPAVTSPPANPAEQAKATFKEVSARVRAFGEAWWPQIRDAWTALDTKQQGTLVVAGVGGLVAGFLLGSFMPVKSAAAFTSLAGAALSLFCFVWITRALDAPGKELLNRSPQSWLVIWACLAALGLLAQVGPSLKRKKPAPTESAAPLA